MRTGRFTVMPLPSKRNTRTNMDTNTNIGMRTEPRTGMRTSTTPPMIMAASMITFITMATCTTATCHIDTSMTTCM